jgi:hypothetical protein
MSNVLSSVRDVESHFRDLESLAARDVETRSRFFKTSNHLIWTPEFFVRDVKTCSRVFKMSNLIFEIWNRLFSEMSKLVRDFSRHRNTFSGSGIICSRC